MGVEKSSCFTYAHWLGFKKLSRPLRDSTNHLIVQESKLSITSLFCHPILKCLKMASIDQDNTPIIRSTLLLQCTVLVAPLVSLYS